MTVFADASKAGEGEIKTLGFGLAIGEEQFRARYIEEASTNGANRIVTVDKEYKTLPSAWLTLNWNFFDVKQAVRTPPAGVPSTTAIKGGMFAGVKFIGGQNNQAFDGFAIGPQITFKTADGVTNRDISVGLGFVTHKTRALASGIVEGQPLPADYTDVKYHQRSENSWILMLSVVL
jgi:hypothetical protein